MTTTVGVHEAKTQLSRLLARVAEGEEVVITSRGRAVARLVAPVRPRQLGMDVGTIWVSDDFGMLSESELSAFGA